MHIFRHAETQPDKAALILADTGDAVSYADLEALANRLANLFRSLNATAGSCVAIMLPNEPLFFAAAWAAQRAGLYFTALSTHLIPDEAAYIARDSGALIFLCASDYALVAKRIRAVLPDVKLLMRYGGRDSRAVHRFESLEEALSDQPVSRISDESAGSEMLYSSGTTGRPKGVRLPMPGGPIDQPTPLVQLVQTAFKMGCDTTYYTPAPLYHAAPLRWAMAVQAVGGTVVISRKFDAEAALGAVARYRANASQWVPTHFVRLLKLPEGVKARYDVSSMKVALHAGAPCPVDVKRAMIDWWGPVLHEYYGGTEGFGGTVISPLDWLSRPGSVGRAVLGKLHICDDEGDEVPPGMTGGVYFEGDNLSEYFGDPEKTAESRNKHGWATYGDIGHVDKEGFLFLTDRKAFTIISGGVNVYPAEIENVLVSHPKVQDVAVVGAPDLEMGERVVAVIQPTDPKDAGPELACELEAYARARLSGIKTPRQFDFIDELPRQPTGKLFKRLIRDRYWSAPAQP